MAFVVRLKHWHRAGLFLLRPGSGDITGQLNMAQFSDTGVSTVDKFESRPAAALSLQMARLRNTSVSIFVRSQSSAKQISC